MMNSVKSPTVTQAQLKSQDKAKSPASRTMSAKGRKTSLTPNVPSDESAPALNVPVDEVDFPLQDSVQQKDAIVNGDKSEDMIYMGQQEKLNYVGDTDDAGDIAVAEGGDFAEAHGSQNASTEELRLNFDSANAMTSDRGKQSSNTINKLATENSGSSADDDDNNDEDGVHNSGLIQQQQSSNHLAAIEQRLEETRKRRKVLQRDMQRISDKFSEVKSKLYIGKDRLLVEEIAMLQAGNHPELRRRMSVIQQVHEDRVNIAKRKFDLHKSCIESEYQSRLVSIAKQILIASADERSSLTFSADKQRVKSTLEVKDDFYDSWCLSGEDLSSCQVSCKIEPLTEQEFREDMAAISQLIN
ncbi:hypothetical protein MIR68_001058 [Amoeboaphelidium protococcarum]|nr:hypothetical protein MIR68_001058 [Amoeboaphelidium protococcarum]